MPFDGKELDYPVTEVGKGLKAALDLFGPNGEHWVNRYPMPCSKPHTEHCIVTAIHVGCGTGVYGRALAAVEAIEPAPVRYNDAEGRTFAEIRSLFLEAIRRVEAGDGER